MRLDLGLDTGGLLVRRVHDRHVAHVDRGLLDNQTTGAGTAGGLAGLGVPGDPVDALDEDALGLGVDGDDLARGALAGPTEDLDGVALLDLHLRCLGRHESEHLRRQRDDLHELLVAQLAAHRAEDAGAPGVTVALEDHCGVLVELDVAAIGTATFLRRAHDDRLDDVALLDVAAGDGVLHRGDDRVADTGIPSTRATENTDAQDLLGTGVVGDTQSRLLLDHFLSPKCRAGSPGAAAEPCRTGITWPSRGSPPDASAWWR